jgi:hypothetical protein
VHRVTSVVQVNKASPARFKHWICIQTLYSMLQALYMHKKFVHPSSSLYAMLTCCTCVQDLYAMFQTSYMHTKLVYSVLQTALELLLRARLLKLPLVLYVNRPLNHLCLLYSSCISIKLGSSWGLILSSTQVNSSQLEVVA